MNEPQKTLTDYLDEHFPDTPLESSLFYNAPVGLRLELGASEWGEDPEAFLPHVLLRARSVFEDVFAAGEQLMVVVRGYSGRGLSACIHPGEAVFPTYLRDKRLQEEVASAVLEWDEDPCDPALTRHQHFLVCSRESVDHIGILKALANQDFAREPRIADSVFFIHPVRHIIFHMYDDRGLDLVAKHRETLFPLYMKYSGWIPDHDRKRIDRIFRSIPL